MECHICNRLISSRYYVDVFDHKICESHLNNDVVSCSSCTGFTTKENALPDGRHLCPVCMNLALKQGDSIEPIKAAVEKAFNRVGFDNLRFDNIPVEIVSAEEMAKIFNMPVNPHNKGLTKIASSMGLSGQTYSYTIYILNYLNKVEFAAALAHEMLHVWLFGNKVQMQQKHVEGFCNMGAYLMWNTLPSSLNKTYLKILHESPDPVYGDGFREIFAMYEEWGWEELIKNVREKKL